MALTFLISADKPKATRQHISFRKYKDIDLEAFKHDLQSSFNTESAETIEDTVSEYDSCLKSVIDKHAPLDHKRITLRPHAPWYDDKLREEKVKKRCLERQWKKSTLNVFKIAYREQCTEYNNLLQKTKASYFSAKIQSCGRDNKAVFSMTNKLLGRSSDNTLPEHVSQKALAETFNTFFVTKIAKIREGFEQDNDLGPVTAHTATTVNIVSPLVLLQPATEDEIHKIICKSPTKSCELDPVPTYLLKECADELIPAITRVVNQSLSSAKVPGTLKHAVIRPLLKKPGMDPEVHNNYRPVSNLTFLSKIIEKVVAARMDRHIFSNQLHEPLQSAYKAHHSTETALLKVQNDILEALDDQKVAVLVLLDLSAAFDTIDHDTLLTRLSQDFAIQGEALKWFQSYLTDRTQAVTIGSERSSLQPLQHGVPQGSVLGSKLFGMYTKPLGTLVSQHGVLYHLYADDSQLYLAFNIDNINVQDTSCSAVATLEQSIDCIRTWMRANKLKLNDSKTKVILFGAKQRLKNVENIKVRVGNVYITPKKCVKNLGVHQDQQLSMEQHIRAVCRSVHMHLHNISRIRRYLTRDSTHVLVQALAISRIDYANSLLTGITKDLLQRLQRLENTCARVVCLTPRMAHMQPVLKDLHWLPVRSRIEFKVLVLTYKALHGSSPSYISSMLNLYKPTRHLRSESQQLLRKPPVSTASFGHRTFSFAASTLWNKLPFDIKEATSLECFKTRLKTHLFAS
jgi:hypothetical protein